MNLSSEAYKKNAQDILAVVRSQLVIRFGLSRRQEHNMFTCRILFGDRQSDGKNIKHLHLSLYSQSRYEMSPASCVLRDLDFDGLRDLLAEWHRYEFAGYAIQDWIAPRPFIGTYARTSIGPTLYRLDVPQISPVWQVYLGWVYGMILGNDLTGIDDETRDCLERRYEAFLTHAQEDLLKIMAW